jgi:hypothetical protein
MRINMLLAGGLMLLGQHAVQAHDYNNDLACTVTMNTGTTAFWTFAINSHDLTGGPGGTLVETGYMGNGKTVMSQQGSRPIWMTNRNATGYWLVPRATPGYALHEDLQGIVTFVHGNNILGVGKCRDGGSVPTQQTVPDIAPE